MEDKRVADCAVVPWVSSFAASCNILGAAVARGLDRVVQ